MKHAISIALLKLSVAAANDVSTSLKAARSGSPQATVHCADEDGGYCAQDASMNLLQNKLEILQSSQLFNAQLKSAHALEHRAPIQSPIRPNILFIVADDLRFMSSYSQPQDLGYTQTPHLNAFVKESLTLRNSHVQLSLCTPSRASILFGRRPDTMHVWYYTYDNQRMEACKTCMTIPGLFKEAGYFTVGMGKVFGEDKISIQDPQSWSDPAFAGDNWFMGNDLYDLRDYRQTGSSVDEASTGQCQDSQVRDHAVSWLRNLTARKSSKPWFVAVGFRKPHMPFWAPQEFYDLYSIDSIRLADNPTAPVDMPPIAHDASAFDSYDDVTHYKGCINELLDTEKAKQVVRSYHACVSYLDYNIGVLLQELKALGQWNKTIVVLWSDHGFKLGEHSGWGKQTNFHVDTNAPVMLRVPGLTDGGIWSQALVEHVDIMATLLDAAGLHALPICPEKEPWLVSHCTEGRSFLRLASNPALVGKNASYSQEYRTRAQYCSDPSRTSDGKVVRYMGYSMHTDTNYRFTAWVDFDDDSKATNWTMYGEDCAFELYDHNVDPEENYNLAYKAEQQVRVEQFFVQLKLGWRATERASLLQDP